MKTNFQYLKSNKKFVVVAVLLITTMTLSMFFSYNPQKLDAECILIDYGVMKCDFECSLKTNFTNSTIRVVVNHNPFSAIYDKLLYNVTSFNFSLPNRNFSYQIWIVANEKDNFKVYENWLTC